MDGPRMDTAHGVVANHHRSGIDAIDGGARRGKKRDQGSTELPARFGSMALTRGYRATIGNGDCAILWSLWHVAAFFVPGMPHQIMPPLSTLLFVALFGVFLAFVFNRAGESVLATILAHLSLNIASGFGGVQLSSIVFWRTLVAIFGALALLIALTSRRRPPQKAPVPVQAE